jgi:hypothetical protein
MRPQEENIKLTRLVADLTLEKAILPAALPRES